MTKVTVPDTGDFFIRRCDLLFSRPAKANLLSFIQKHLQKLRRFCRLSIAFFCIE